MGEAVLGVDDEEGWADLGGHCELFSVAMMMLILGDARGSI